MKPYTVLESSTNKVAADVLRDKDGADTPLPESAERYRSLVEDTSDGFYAFNAASGRFVFLNRRGGVRLGV
jgi:PAS domain-containing protein